MSAPVVVIHCRQRMARLGGNSFYRDRRVREVSTFCGAEATGYDYPWRDRKRFASWVRHEDGVTFAACPQCLQLIQEREVTK